MRSGALSKPYMRIPAWSGSRADDARARHPERLSLGSRQVAGWVAYARARARIELPAALRYERDLGGASRSTTRSLNPLADAAVQRSQPVSDRFESAPEPLDRLPFAPCAHHYRCLHP